MLNSGTGGAVGIVSAGTVPASPHENDQSCSASVVVWAENVGNALANLGVYLKTS